MDYELLLIMDEVKDTNEQVTNQDLLDALQSLNESSVNTNNSIKELTEYLVTKDRQSEQKEATEKKQAEQEAEEQKQIEEQQAKEQESIEAEEKAVQDASDQADADNTQLIIETLQSIDEGIQMQNQLSAVDTLYFGIIIGLIFIKIFIDRLIR